MLGSVQHSIVAALEEDQEKPWGRTRWRLLASRKRVEGMELRQGIHTEEEGMQQWRNLDSGKETDAEKVSLSRHQPWEEEVGRTGSGNHR